MRKSAIAFIGLAMGAFRGSGGGVGERIVTDMASIGLPDGNGSYGPHDIAFDSTGRAYVLTGFATNPVSGDASVRDTIIGDDDLGQVLALNGFNGGFENVDWTQISDLVEYELLNDPDGTGLISNPYSFVLQDDTTAFVAESGANNILSVDLTTGEVDLGAVIGERVVTDPRTGEDAVTQSVPTAITQGPDDAFYISELTGVPYPEEEARIYRWVPGEEPEVFADGFTQLIDVAFDSQGNLYALEYATRSLILPDPGGILDREGALTRISPDGTRTTILDEGLISPNSLLIDSDDSIYISNYGTFASIGEIVRVDEGVSVPEPVSAFSLLALGVGGIAMRAKRKAAAASS